MSTEGSKPEGNKKADWSPDQYLLFQDARNRPISDLITSLGPSFKPSRIIDLGCGPGNSTALLASRFPSATITGVDSSPAMLTAARKALPYIDFTLADLRTYTPPTETSSPEPTLLFSNAVFHWLRHSDRIPTILRLLQTLPQGTGSMLALQMPDNYDESSHRCMRDAAAAPGPWRPFFEELVSKGEDKRPDLDPIESHLEYYDALKPHCDRVEMWTTRYVHVLEGHGEIVEWVRGTGLQPFVNVLPEGGVREGFLREYRERLEREYPRARGDGKVLLGYPRRFVVLWR